MPKRRARSEPEEVNTSDLVLPEDFEPGTAPGLGPMSVDTGDLVLPDDFDPSAPPVPRGAERSAESLFGDLPDPTRSNASPLIIEGQRRGRGGTIERARRPTETDELDLDTEPGVGGGVMEPPVARAPGKPAPRLQPARAPEPARPVRTEDPGLTNSELEALDAVSSELGGATPEPPRKLVPPVRAADAREQARAASTAPRPKAPEPVLRKESRAAPVVAPEPPPRKESRAVPAATPKAQSSAKLSKVPASELPPEQRAERVERAAQRMQAELEARRSRPAPSLGHGGGSMRPPVPDDEPSNATAVLPATTSETQPRGEIRVVILADGDRGSHRLEKSETVVGRSSACDIRLAHGSLSRQHASFLRRAGRLYVRDLGSQNGTFVNETRLQRDAENELFVGDAVKLGQVPIRLEGAALAPRPAGLAVPSHTDVLAPPQSHALRNVVIFVGVVALAAAIGAVVLTFGGIGGPPRKVTPEPTIAKVEAPPTEELPVPSAAAFAGPGEPEKAAEPPKPAKVPDPPKPDPAAEEAAIAAAVAAARGVEPEPDPAAAEEPAPRAAASSRAKRGKSRGSGKSSDAGGTRVAAADAAFEDEGEEPAEAPAASTLPRRGSEDDREVARDALGRFRDGDLDGAISAAESGAPRLAGELKGFKKTWTDGNGSMGFGDDAAAVSSLGKAFRLHTQLTGGRGKFAGELKGKLAKLNFSEGRRQLSEGDSEAARRSFSEVLKYDPGHAGAKRELSRLAGGGDAPAPEKKKKSARNAGDDAWESSD